MLLCVLPAHLSDKADTILIFEVGNWGRDTMSFLGHPGRLSQNDEPNLGFLSSHTIVLPLWKYKQMPVFKNEALAKHTRRSFPSMDKPWNRHHPTP